MKSLQAWIKKQKSFAVMILALFAFRSTLADQYTVPTGSMEPNILPGDRIFVNKIAYDLRVPFTNISLLPTADPQRGDIVAFQSVDNRWMTMVKRLIGLPGDHIQIIDGIIRINGEALTEVSVEELLHSQQKPFHYNEKLEAKTFAVQRFPELIRSENLDFVVPQDHFFFMGDNRDNSSDGRSWGFVPRNLLRGKALSVLVSLDWSEKVPKLRWDRIGKEF